jgi:hypothetical protein
VNYGQAVSCVAAAWAAWFIHYGALGTAAGLLGVPIHIARSLFGPPTSESSVLLQAVVSSLPVYVASTAGATAAAVLTFVTVRDHGTLLRRPVIGPLAISSAIFTGAALAYKFGEAKFLYAEDRAWIVTPFFAFVFVYSGWMFVRVVGLLTRTSEPAFRVLPSEPAEPDELSAEPPAPVEPGDPAVSLEAAEPTVAPPADPTDSMPPPDSAGPGAARE